MDVIVKLFVLFFITHAVTNNDESNDARGRRTSSSGSPIQQTLPNVSRHDQHKTISMEDVRNGSIAINKNWFTSTSTSSSTIDRFESPEVQPTQSPQNHRSVTTPRPRRTTLRPSTTSSRPSTSSAPRTESPIEKDISSTRATTQSTTYAPTTSRRGQEPSSNTTQKVTTKKPSEAGSTGDDDTPSMSWPDGHYAAAVYASDTPSYKCGGDIFISTLPTTIQSPGWTENKKYPPFSNCVWTLHGNNSDHRQSPPFVKIRIVYLDVEDDVECRYDYLQFNGQRHICGVIIEKEHILNSSVARIDFKSDNSYEFRGFVLEVSLVYEGCTPIVSLPFGSERSLTSPLFPRNYPDAMDCWTLLRAESSDGKLLPNVSISVTFEFINMEPDQHCAFDFVELFDGWNGSGKSFGPYCDFNVTWETDWSGSTSDSMASSPSPQDVRSLENFKTQTPSPIEELVFTSSGPELLVHFKSDQLLSAKGYKAIIRVEDRFKRSSGQNLCGWIVDEEAQTLKSPNYPHKYPPNTDCTVTIVAPSESDKVLVIFETFYLESDQNCTLDRLEIYDDDHSSTSTESDASEDDYDPYRSIPSPNQKPMQSSSRPVRTYCGHKQAQFKYISRSSTVRLRLVSDDSAEYPGFSVKWSYLREKENPNSGAAKKLIFDLVPTNATVLSGSSHLLSCLPRDIKSSNETVRWIKDNKNVGLETFEGGTRLLIREFSVLDAGRYVCQWGNHTRNAYLTQRPAPCSMIFLKRPQHVTLSEDDDVTLECQSVTSSSWSSSSSSRNPDKYSSRHSSASTNSQSSNRRSTKITWLKDGRPLPTNSSKYDILRSGSLFITGVGPDDSGFYTCRSTHPDHSACVLDSIAMVKVNERADIDSLCGRPSAGKPTLQKPALGDHGKIVGGSDAQKGAFPWQVMFWDYKRKAFCGGSLLNERWIVTAAHCFEKKSANEVPPPEPEVRLGRYDQTAVEEENQFVTKIQQIIKHPEFSRLTYDNDIALVKVEKHIPFTQYIAPICIGKDKAEIENIFFRDKTLVMGHVTGWGMLKEGGPQPKFLQELKLPIQPQKTCEKSTKFPISSGMFCAGYAQEVIGDACKGDSGGPFVALHDDRWYLLGIVSWGEGCGRAGKYGFYTRVANYASWIRDYIKL